MKMLKCYPENMDKAQQYKMMKDPDSVKMVDLDGTTITIKSWAKYEVPDQQTGEMKTVLSIEDESGTIASTISEVFMREFQDIIEYLGDNPGPIKVSTGTSKNGRTFVTCGVA